MAIKKGDILRTLKDLKEELKIKYKVNTIGRFGSYVINEKRDTNDSDFLIEFEDNADLIHFIILSHYLEGIFNTKVDFSSNQA